jgi:hypothetical protein
MVKEAEASPELPPGAVISGGVVETSNPTISIIEPLDSGLGEKVTVLTVPV